MVLSVRSPKLSVTAFLLATCAFSPVMAASQQDEAVPTAKPKVGTGATGARSVVPSPAKTTAPASIVQSDPEEIHVVRTRSIAGGMMKRQTAPEATSSLSVEAIAKKSAISTPLQMIATLPGVNYGTQDAFGLSIRNSLTLRGFSGTQLGYVIDGVPGVDQAYYNPYSETYADNENLSDITLIASTSRINDPVQTSSGGELIETVRDPSAEFGGLMSYSAGTYRSQRAFGRLDSGYIGQSGVRLFASASYTAADLFAGSGRSNRTHVDFKATKEWGDIAKSSLFVSYNDWNNARSNPYTLAAFQTAARVNDGFSVGNYSYCVTKLLYDSIACV